MTLPIGIGINIGIDIGFRIFQTIAAHSCVFRYEAIFYSRGGISQGRDVTKKKREKVGILKIPGGGVYPNPTGNMGDPPTINVLAVAQRQVTAKYSIAQFTESNAH